MPKGRTAPLPPAGPFAYLVGMRRPLIRFDAEGDPINPLRVNAPDLIAWIESRDPKAINSWRDLGADEYARAFTAARTAGIDVIDDLYFAFADTIASGGTEVDFAKAVIPTLQQKGWLAGDGRTIATRVALIYDTNLRMARGAGQWDRVQRVKAGLPYLRGVTAQDQRVRHPPKSHDDHRAWQDIVLPVDHPFWTRWWPPLGFRCRCGVIQLTRSAALRIGVTNPEDLADREARLGTPIFKPPGGGVIQQLAGMVENANAPRQAPGRGWTVNGQSGLSADQANALLEAQTEGRMPGLPLLSLPAIRAEGASAWNADTAAAVSTLVGSLLDTLLN